MINKIPLLIFMIFLGGCATYSTMMVNPKNGDVFNCHSSGAGIIPMMLASSEHETCVEDLREIGFEPVNKDKKTPEKQEEKEDN